MVRIMDPLPELIALSDKAYDRLCSRLEGIGDEEYLWAPAPVCWSVLNEPEGTRFEFGLLVGGPASAPPTTIAWRLVHIIDLLKEDRCAIVLGLKPVANAHARWITTSSAEAIAYLELSYETWRDYLTRTDPDALGTKPAQGPWPTRMTFVNHIIDELIHHAAEIGVLRDVWQATRPRDELVQAMLRADRRAVERAGGEAVAVLRKKHPNLILEAAAYGKWDAVDLLIDMEFPVDTDGGATPLHHAAGLGRPAIVRRLVERGARTDARDDTFKATPLMWAQTMSQRLGDGPHGSGADWPSVIEYLTGSTTR